MRETSQPTFWYAFHDFGGHESQADHHDELRVRQQREGLRIVHAGTNEELDIEELSASPKARKPSPGLEGVKVLPSGPWFADGVSTAPLLPDAAYMGLVLPIPGDMSAGWLVDDDDALLPGAADDDDGLDGNSRVAICASVH